MFAEGLPVVLDHANETDCAELERSIEEATYFQVRDLTVSIMNDEVRVMGVCETYYVKQMVTVAVQECMPRRRLLNLVRVTAG